MNINIPFYNLLNIFSVGVVFFIGLIVLDFELFINLKRSLFFRFLTSLPEVLFVVITFAILYEVGFIINRVGSVIVEPLLIKFRLLKFDQNYCRYNEIKKDYPVLEILSREYAASRTRIVLFVLLFIYSLVVKEWISTIVLLVIILFYWFSMKKYSYKILKLMS